MAKLKSGVAFTGLLGGISVYTMKGVEGLVARMPGGPTNSQIKHSPSCVNIRRNNMEFGGRSTAASNIRHTMINILHLADYNFTPELNKLSKPVQYADTVGKKGQRSVYYSRHRYILNGFNLNIAHPFDSVVRHQVHFTVDRPTATATIVLPKLIAGENLLLPWQCRQFRFVASIGIADDCIFEGDDYKRKTLRDSQAVYADTAWQFCNQPFAGETLVLQMKRPELLHEQSSLVVSVGVEVESTFPNQFGSGFQRIGCAKILGAG